MGRRLLKLALLHYVDDYFGPERWASTKTAMAVFARLVCACLGGDAVSERKLEHGNPLVVLGIEVFFSSSGTRYWPSPEKVEKWLRILEEAIRSGELSPGEASRLAGRLQWNGARNTPSGD